MEKQALILRACFAIALMSTIEVDWVYLSPLLRLLSMTMTADDLKERVEVTLDRFIKAVGEMTSSSNSTERHDPEGIASMTAIDREAEQLPGES